MGVRIEGARLSSRGWVADRRHQVPACCSHEDYWRWLEKRPQPVPHNWFCEDCSQEYARRMQAEGRCAHPRVNFIRDEDGFISGVLPADDPFFPVPRSRDK